MTLGSVKGRGGQARPGKPIAEVLSVADGTTLIDVTDAVDSGDRRFALAGAPGKGRRPVVQLGPAGAPEAPALVLTESPEAGSWALTGPAAAAGHNAAAGGDRAGPQVTIEAPSGSETVAVTPPFAGTLTTANAAGDVRVGIWAGREARGDPQAAPRALVDGDRWSLLRPLPKGTWTLVASQADANGRVGTSDPVTLTVTEEPTLAAAGDIACAPDNKYWNGGEGSRADEQCRQKVVSDQILRTDPAAVIALGDIQYEAGDPKDYERSWNPTWGRLEPVMWPAIGNHEVFPLPDMEPGDWYWDHFNGVGENQGIAGERGKGWYSVDAGWWHIVVLNSNCDTTAELCDPDDEQVAWLRDDLEASNARCTLAAFHHPLRTIGEVPDLDELAPVYELLEKADVDLILTGHAHDYERWAPLTASGRRDDEAGIRQLVVGTGGVGLSDTPETDPRVELSSEFNDGRFWEGFADVELGQGIYAWDFVSESGDINDSGTGTCH